MRIEGKTVPPAILKEMKRIKELLYSFPDVREDMIADLRNQVSGKMYKVEAEQVAERIIHHGICILGALERPNVILPDTEVQSANSSKA